MIRMARLHSLLPAVSPLCVFLLASCASEPEKKPVPPTTDTSRIPWNQPLPGQGQGQFGMMPQNQYRR
jgi:hypothetical protein